MPSNLSLGFNTIYFLYFYEKTFCVKFIDLRFFDILDIVLVALLLYYIYRLVKGSSATRIIVGIIFIYLFFKFTQLLKMEMLSSIFGEFIEAGIIALVVVFQQEIRKFLLMVGSAKFGNRRSFWKQWRFIRENQDDEISTDIKSILEACKSMGKTKTGALIVIKRETELDFVKSTGDQMNITVNKPIIRSIFYKNSTLHDGALLIEDNIITATRVILPVSNDRRIPLRYGLRHRAAISISEKTDALALVTSEETGKTSYIKNGTFIDYDSFEELAEIIKQDLS